MQEGNQAEALSNNANLNDDTVRDSNKSFKQTNHVKPRLMAIVQHCELTQVENQVDLPTNEVYAQDYAVREPDRASE